MDDRQKSEILLRISKLIKNPDISEKELMKLVEIVDSLQDVDASQSIRQEINEMFHGRGAPNFNPEKRTKAKF